MQTTRYIFPLKARDLHGKKVTYNIFIQIQKETCASIPLNYMKGQLAEMTAKPLPQEVLTTEIAEWVRKFHPDAVVTSYGEVLGIVTECVDAPKEKATPKGAL